MPKQYFEGSIIGESDIEQWELQMEGENYYEATLKDGKTVSMDRIFDGQVFRYRVNEILKHLFTIT
jgi:hypothetical protein